MKSWRLLLVLAALIFIFPAVVFNGWWFVRFSGPQVVNNALVGQSEAQIRRAYGAPESDRTGYDGLAGEIPPALPKTPIRSLTFHPGRLFHPKGGTLCVWLTEQDGKWVCFESCWFADDVVF